MLIRVEKFKLPIKFNCLEDKTNKILISVLVITFNSRQWGSKKSLLSYHISAVMPAFVSPGAKCQFCKHYYIKKLPKCALKLPSACWSFHPAYRPMTHTATFCWMLVKAFIYLPSESIYCNSWGNTKGIHAFQPHVYGLHCLCAACFNFYQPKATISKTTHSTATACDYCSSNSIKPKPCRHLTAPSFIMHASAWCLQRRSRNPGIPLTALIKAVAAHKKKKKFQKWFN